VRGVLAAAALVCALVLPAASQASFIVDRNATGATLRITGQTAIVNWTSRGTRRSVVLAGAANARPPSQSVPQVSFHAAYRYGAQAGGSCRPYTGPALPFLVTACDAPDGSHWALQSWQRLQPNYGGRNADSELHASHWTGDLPKIEVWLDWSYDGRFQHLFGRYTYEGQPVHGFRSTGVGSPLDPYGRNLYLDTLDSRYGAGWRRENSFLAHKPTGVFCYGFYLHGGAPGTGSAYRLTAQGPGVTPIVSWSGQALPEYDAALEQQMNDLQRSLGDRLCRHN
jgi:hypothetical protein